ncbi:MAG: hypothetical protein JW891_03005 [Candidatus Lokiarchaeota archaeon]|nr:hypothetical protein [Candidatus Lokiarchaeota archaeon]
MKKTKGIFMHYIVTGIKANKTDAYKKLLSKDAKKIISQNILASDWYPFEIYKELLNALAKVEARGDMNIVQNWGRNFGHKAMTELYAQTLEEGNVRKALEKYKRFSRIVFNFNSINLEYISGREIHVSYEDFDPDFEVYYHLAVGWIEKFVEICAGVMPESCFLSKSWEGDGITKFRISW